MCSIGLCIYHIASCHGGKNYITVIIIIMPFQNYDIHIIIIIINMLYTLCLSYCSLPWVGKLPHWRGLYHLRHTHQQPAAGLREVQEVKICLYACLCIMVLQIYTIQEALSSLPVGGTQGLSSTVITAGSCLAWARPGWTSVQRLPSSWSTWWLWQWEGELEFEREMFFLMPSCVIACGCLIVSLFCFQPVRMIYAVGRYFSYLITEAST